MLADAHRRDLISRDPCDKVKWKDEAPPPEISLKVPSPTDVERLIAKTAEPWCLLVELAAYSGLGAGELTGLQARHIDAVARSVRVEQIIMDLDGVLLIGKPRSKAGYRTVTDLDPDLCGRLAAHLVGKRSTKFVFGGRDDDGKPRPYSHRNFAVREFSPPRRRSACRCASMTCGTATRACCSTWPSRRWRSPRDSDVTTAPSFCGRMVTGSPRRTSGSVAELLLDGQRPALRLPTFGGAASPGCLGQERRGRRRLCVFLQGLSSRCDLHHIIRPTLWITSPSANALITLSDLGFPSRSAGFHAPSRSVASLRGYGQGVDRRITRVYLRRSEVHRRRADTRRCRHLVVPSEAEERRDPGVEANSDPGSLVVLADEQNHRCWPGLFRVQRG